MNTYEVRKAEDWGPGIDHPFVIVQRDDTGCFYAHALAPTPEDAKQKAADLNAEEAAEYGVTVEQLRALQDFAISCGGSPHWPEKLADAWINGSDVQAIEKGHLLRQIRNSKGPSWLTEISSKSSAPTP